MTGIDTIQTTLIECSSMVRQNPLNISKSKATDGQIQETEKKTVDMVVVNRSHSSLTYLKNSIVAISWVSSCPLTNFTHPRFFCPASPDADLYLSLTGLDADIRVFALQRSPLFAVLRETWLDIGANAVSRQVPKKMDLPIPRCLCFFFFLA